MKIDLVLNIQMSKQPTLLIEGALFKFDMNIKQKEPITLIR